MAHSVICDVCGDPHAARGVTLSVDGDVAAVDLCQRHQDVLWAALGPLFECGVRASTPLVPDVIRDLTTGKPVPYRAAAGVDLTAVRTWAKANGVPVADRGRISADVIALYREANDA